jgi:hypothetical protein
VASNLACVGLAVEGQSAFGDLVLEAVNDTAVIGRIGDSTLRRWEDPSGARLLFTLVGSDIVGFLPSYASETQVNFSGVTAANEDIVTAAVVDEDGEQLTSAALELEQRMLIGKRPLAEAVGAVTAFASSVTVHADAEAFASSSESLLGPSDESDSEPPPHYVEQGWSWPPRMAPESFISYGVFGEGTDAHADARLNGIVLSASQRTTHLTGQPFIVARVRSAGFEVDLCMAHADHPHAPAVGSVVGGEVYLVGSIPALEQDPTTRRRWFRRT